MRHPDADEIDLVVPHRLEPLDFEFGEFFVVCPGGTDHVQAIGNVRFAVREFKVPRVALADSNELCKIAGRFLREKFGGTTTENGGTADGQKTTTMKRSVHGNKRKATYRQ